MTWFRQNWDKVLGFFLSIVIAGVVGFFAAIRTVDSEVSSLRASVVRLETDFSNLVKPKLPTIDENKLAAGRLTDRLKLLERENEIQRATANLLNLSRDQARKETVNELRELLKEKN